MREKFVFLFLSLACLCLSFTFKFDGWFEYDFDQPTDSTKYSVMIPFMGTYFTASGGFRRDNIVILIPPYADVLMNNYWYWDEGFFSWSNNVFTFEVGVKENHAGPGQVYQLFVSENGFSYPSIHSVAEIGKFRVETLWGGIRVLKTDIKPVKAFNYRALVYTPFDGFEIAYEDSILYLDRFFDPYYFFVPIPVPGIQEFWHLSAPWGYSSYELNDNSMVGAWIKYYRENYSFYSEILIDDINMNRFLAPDSPYQNPDKIAFLAGFTGKSGPVKLTFEVAGATAFTFQRTTDDPYEYTYFEDSQFPVEKNMIGYKHGENNIACTIKFEYESDSWSYSAEYEGLIYGDRTPDIPWHGKWSSVPYGTYWLTGDVQSEFSLRMRIAYQFKNLLPGVEKAETGFSAGFYGDNPFVGFDLSIVLNIND